MLRFLLIVGLTLLVLVAGVSRASAQERERFGLQRRMLQERERPAQPPAALREAQRPQPGTPTPAQRSSRLTPEERQALRRQIDAARGDVYRNGAWRR